MFFCKLKHIYIGRRSFESSLRTQSTHFTSMNSAFMKLIFSEINIDLGLTLLVINMKEARSQVVLLAYYSAPADRFIPRSVYRCMVAMHTEGWI